MSSWDDRVVVVTGGAQGIGEAIVRRFSGEGARVAILDIQEEAGRKLAKELGSRALFARCDVAEEADWELAIGSVLSEFGRLDVLVNNAGVLQMETIERTSAEDYLRLVRVNELGTFLGIQAVIEPMRAVGGGAIVNMSTIHALKGCAGAFMLGYGASKAAVISLTESASLELARYRIRVSCVSPGWVATPMSLEATQPPEMIESMAKQGTIGGANPFGAQIRPEEVADSILFIASDTGAAYNGGNLVIDRGALTGRYPDLPADPVPGLASDRGLESETPDRVSRS